MKFASCHICVIIVIYNWRVTHVHFVAIAQRLSSFHVRIMLQKKKKQKKKRLSFFVNDLKGFIIHIFNIGMCYSTYAVPCCQNVLCSGLSFDWSRNHAYCLTGFSTRVCYVYVYDETSDWSLVELSVIMTMVMKHKVHLVQRTVWMLW